MPLRAPDDVLRHLCRARDHADRHYLFMAGLAERYVPADPGSAIEEKPAGTGTA